MKWKFCKFFICNKTEPIKNQKIPTQGNAEMMQANDENIAHIVLRQSSLKFFSARGLHSCGQTSKENKVKTDKFLDELLKKYKLTEDYNNYLKQAIERDFTITSDNNWEDLFAKFAEQKKSIQEVLKSNYSQRALYEFLMKEIFLGNYVAVHYLLEANAPIKMSSNYRLVQNFQTQGFYPMECTGSAFHAAAYCGSYAITMLLYQALKDRNQDKDEFQMLLTNDKNRTPLHYAALCYNDHNNYLPKELIQFYLNHGCSINTSDKDGMTPLHLAVYNYPFHAFKVEYGLDLPFEKIAAFEGKKPKLVRIDLDKDESKSTLQIINLFLENHASLYTEATRMEDRRFPITPSIKINKFKDEELKQHIIFYYQKVYDHLKSFQTKQDFIMTNPVSYRTILQSTPTMRARK